MEVKNAGPPVHAAKNKGGRPFDALTKVRRDLRDWARKSGKEAFENLRKLALHGENEFVRLAATKEWLDRGFGKPVPADEGQGGPTQVVVVRTGVPRSDYPDEADPPRPLIAPDGRDIFATHTPKPLSSSACPVLHPHVVEPPQHRLFEGPPDKPSDGHGNKS